MPMLSNASLAFAQKGHVDFENITTGRSAMISSTCVCAGVFSGGIAVDEELKLRLLLEAVTRLPLVAKANATAAPKAAAALPVLAGDTADGRCDAAATMGGRAARKFATAKAADGTE